MKEKAPLIARVLLGLIFFVFGLNGFLQFIPMPPPPEAAMNFMGALGASGYFFPLLKITEIAIGLSLLSGFYVPLALVIAAPIVVNIIFFHIFLAPGAQGMMMPVLMTALGIYLAKENQAAFAGVLKK